jgi:hypothetical protein
VQQKWWEQTAPGQHCQHADNIGGKSEDIVAILGTFRIVCETDETTYFTGQRQLNNWLPVWSSDLLNGCLAADWLNLTRIIQN